MPMVTLEEAQAHLPELIDQLRPGESVVITRDARPWPVSCQRCRDTQATATGQLQGHAHDCCRRR